MSSSSSDPVLIIEQVQVLLERLKSEQAALRSEEESSHLVTKKWSSSVNKSLSAENDYLRSKVQELQYIIESQTRHNFGKRSNALVRTNSLTQTPPSTPRAESSDATFHLVACTDEVCDIIEPDERNAIVVPHSVKTSVKLVWRRRPQKVLLVKKPHDVDCKEALLLAAKMLLERDVEVCAEAAVREELVDDECGSQLTYLEAESIMDASIDFAVSMGGDGTVIWTSALFPYGCPPVLSVALGSLGFLTPFKIAELSKSLDRALAGDFYISLRSRLVAQVDGSPLRHVVLNEVVVDRGPSNSLVELDLHVSSNGAGEPVTRLMGDGLIVATPTGSTAYSLAAGGSIVHPSIPSIAVTPVCPHSLSFRPIILPDSSHVSIRVPEDARTSAFVSFDGKDVVELHPGSAVSMRISSHPVPCIHAVDNGWIHSLKSTLYWNERVHQVPYAAAKK